MLGSQRRTINRKKKKREKKCNLPLFTSNCYFYWRCGRVCCSGTAHCPVASCFTNERARQFLTSLIISSKINSTRKTRAHTILHRQTTCLFRPSASINERRTRGRMNGVGDIERTGGLATKTSVQSSNRCCGRHLHGCRHARAKGTRTKIDSIIVPPRRTNAR